MVKVLCRSIFSIMPAKLITQVMSTTHMHMWLRRTIVCYETSVRCVTRLPFGINETNFSWPIHSFLFFMEDQSYSLGGQIKPASTTDD